MTAFFMPFEHPFAFEQPPIFAPRHRARCFRSEGAARCCMSPRGSAGCGSLFKLAFIIFVLPTLVRMGFFVLATVGAMMMHGLIGVAVISSIAMLVRSSCTCISSHVCPTEANSNVKHPASAAADPKASEKEASHPAPQRQLDLSSIQLVTRTEDTNDEGLLMNLVVAAPGVRAADLSVGVVDRYLHIKGESTKGAETFCVDRRILVPQDADMDTIKATHADGTLTLVIKRKVAKRIEVVQAAADVMQAAAKGPLDPSAAAAAAVAVDEYERALEGATHVPLDEWEEAVPLARASKKDE